MFIEILAGAGLRVYLTDDTNLCRDKKGQYGSGGCHNE